MMSVVGWPSAVRSCAREKKMPSGPALNRKYLPRATPHATRSTSDAFAPCVEFSPGLRRSCASVSRRASVAERPAAAVVYSTLPFPGSVWSIAASPSAVLPV